MILWLECVLNTFDLFERFHEPCCSLFCLVSVLQRPAYYRRMFYGY